MARQSTNPTKPAAKKAAETPKEGTVSNTEAAPVADESPAEVNTTDTAGVTDTATVEATPAADTAAPAEKPAEAALDISAFTKALDVALSEMDPTTGTLAPGQIAPVVKAYADLDGTKAKAAARQVLEVGIKEGLDKSEIPKARALNTVRGEVAKGKATASKKEAEPVDPTQAFVETVTSLRLAYSHVISNVPEGVAANWEDQANELATTAAADVSTLVAWNGEGDQPDVSSVAKRALRLAKGGTVKAGKSTGGGGTRAPFTGTRRNVAKHIQSAFADKPVGAVMTIAEVVSHKSEEYGDDHPSPGAVSARVFDKDGNPTSIEGFEGVAAAGDKPKSVRKTA